MTRRQTYLRSAFAIAAGLALSSCSHVPMTGPTTSTITDEPSSGKPARFEVVDVDQSILKTIEIRPKPSLYATFGSENTRSEMLIGPGDIITVGIWETNGGLFSSESGKGNSVIPPQPVAQDGTIVIPYAGHIRAAGRSLQSLGASIQSALQGKAIDPQIVASIQPVYNTVTVVGESTKGGLIPLSGRGDRILDMIATTGLATGPTGLTTPFYEMAIQLTRNGHTVRIPLTRLISDPAENVFVHAGDVVTLVHDPQRVVVAGAVNKTVEVPFEPDRTTLSQAIATTGGITDLRADPTGVFVFRYETADMVAKIRPQSSLLATESRIPVIYHFNFQDPIGIFLARDFHVADRDIVYISNAPLTDLEKLFHLFSTLFAPASAVAVTTQGG
jgi:polysaccharide export outer membrane protein